MNVKIAHYKQIDRETLYQIFQLRSLVFVVEQNCPYLDLDGKDREGFHAYATVDNQVIGTARILPPDVSYPGSCSIGRVAIHAHHRHGQKGSNLMRAVMYFISKEYPETPVTISAQEYLIDFYKQFGFKETNERYLEDAIPHVKMKYVP